MNGDRPTPDDALDILDNLAADDGSDLPDFSCERCVHRDVCGIRRGIAPMLASWAETMGDVPIAVNDLAQICAEYKPEVDGE